MILWTVCLNFSSWMNCSHQTTWKRICACCTLWMEYRIVPTPVHMYVYIKKVKLIQLTYEYRTCDVCAPVQLYLSTVWILGVAELSDHRLCPCPTSSSIWEMTSLHGKDSQICQSPTDGKRHPFVWQKIANFSYPWQHRLHFIHRTEVME